MYRLSTTGFTFPSRMRPARTSRSFWFSCASIRAIFWLTSRDSATVMSLVGGAVELAVAIVEAADEGAHPALAVHRHQGRDLLRLRLPEPRRLSLLAQPLFLPAALFGRLLFGLLPGLRGDAFLVGCPLARH